MEFPLMHVSQSLLLDFRIDALSYENQQTENYQTYA